MINSYRTLVSFNQKDYNQAYLIASQVINNKKFKSSYERFRQQWIVKEAYIHFLIRIGKVDVSLYPDHQLKLFRLTRFLNDVDMMIKDKKGMNVPVIIIEILTLILDEKWDTIENRISGLNQYVYRYLKAKNRSYYFIKMLSSLSDLEYNPTRIRKKVNKYHNRLKAIPFEMTEQEIQLEIIPYEDLWEMTLNLLDESEAN